MSDQARRAAGILAQCKWLRDKLSQWETQAKAALAQELTGGERTKAVAADGTIIGSVTLAEGARSMSIDNEDGFLAWVKQRYPTEVVETVRPSFVKACAEKVKVFGGLPDANGELCPHVSLSHAEPKATVTLSDNDRAVIEDMFMHRHLPQVIEEMERIELPVVHGENPLLPPSPPWTVTMEDGRTYEVPAGTSRVEDGGEVYYPEPPPVDDEADPMPFIEEGPPNWAESNTFETSDAVKNRRR